MRIHAAQPLFAWGQLEDCPSLVTIRDFLQTVPDAPLLDGLRAHRGHGRDGYPVGRLWHIVLLTVLLRHGSFNACLAELHRNPAFCRLIGVTSVEQIPRGWNLSRFLDVLGQEPHLSALRAVFDELARRLGRAVPDLGRQTAGDATALSARAKADAKAVEAERGQGLPQPSGGRKEYTDEAGEVTRVVEWFGRLDQGRAAVERVNARLKLFWGTDDGNVTGARRFHALVGAEMVVHLVFAALPAKATRWEGRLCPTRLGPVAEALRQAQPA